MGEADVRRHISSDLHKRNRAARMQTAAHMKQLNVTSLMMAENELTSMELKTRRAEVKFAMFIMVAEKGHPRPLRKYSLPPAVSKVPPAVPTIYRQRYPRHTARAHA